ncbi:MAG: MarR family winged helix-turn-helix transcriptional regulator [Gemmatimonadaceae bacterium]
MEEQATVVMNAIRRVVKALRQAEVNSTEGLAVGAAQLFVLREVAKAGVLTVTELARRTATSQSSVSEVVSRLATRGLVVRGQSEGDRRRAAISLTLEGTALLARSVETVQERMIAAFRRLPPARQEALASTLGEWIAESGMGDLEATMFFEPGARRET